MKTINRNGFSLAEFLITLTIISIITTMGISISQKGIEKSYNYYIYNGYNSLSLAIADAYSHNYSQGTEDFSNHLIKILNGKVDSAPDIDGNTEFTTPNNIIFKILKFNPQEEGTPQSNRTKILIKMYTPKANDSDGYNNNLILLLLDPENLHYGLIPATNHQSNLIFPNQSTRQGHLSIYKRHDLLPFTIDNGENGKIVQTYDYDNNILTSPEFLNKNDTKKKLYSYYDAFCNLYKDEKYNITYMKPAYENIDFDYSNCTHSFSESGGLKLLNPKKIF